MTKQKKTAAIVLAAGMGTRMRSSRAKVMHEIAGRPMVSHLLDTLQKLELEEVVVVVGPDMLDVADAVAPHKTAVQNQRLGTAHAVQAGLEGLSDEFSGDVLVLYGDTPLISEQTLNAMLEARAVEPAPAAVVLGFWPEDPTGYGRLIVDEEDDTLVAIVEHKDASPEEKTIGLCNSGVMALGGEQLHDFLSRIGNDNANGEYYLTDIVHVAGEAGFTCVAVEGDEAELLGVNSRIDLAMAETTLQDELRSRAMSRGATLIDPSSVYFSWDTQLGQDVVVEPGVVFGMGVTVGDNVRIKAYSHIEGTTIGEGSTVGPFARLRPGAEIGSGAKIGNFVEIKKSVIEDGAKVSHLSYIGDARVGTDANVGAGTITCNYDGFNKHHTDIGAGAFIGSNSALVAPVKIGDGAIIGAGSTISKDVDADALGVERAEHRQVPGWAETFRNKNAPDDK